MSTLRELFEEEGKDQDGRYGGRILYLQTGGVGKKILRPSGPVSIFKRGEKKKTKTSKNRGEGGGVESAAAATLAERGEKNDLREKGVHVGRVRRT